MCEFVHASLACVCTSSAYVFYNVFFHTVLSETGFSGSDTVCLLCLHLALIPLGSTLSGSTGILAVLHAFEGDVDDGDQASGGAQGAQQPVRVGLAQDPQDVALVEAQLAGLGGYVVAQRSYFTWRVLSGFSWLG